MVVPKMVRTERGAKVLTTAPATGDRNGAFYPPMSIPASTGLESARSPLLARALAAIERHTRSLLAGPSKPIGTAPISFLDSRRPALANARPRRLEVLQLSAPVFPIPSENQIAKIVDIQDRHAVRELLLSKITSTLLSRSGRVDPRLATNPEEERWSKASHSV